MIETTCRRCKTRMLQIPGWPERIHPECLPVGHVAWTRRQMAEWLAEHEQEPAVSPPSSAVGARGDRHS